MASGASGVGCIYPTSFVGKRTRGAPGRVQRAAAGYRGAMNIGRIVREVEVLPDTDEEPLPVVQPTPDPVSEPHPQPA